MSNSSLLKPDPEFSLFETEEGILERAERLAQDCGEAGGPLEAGYRELFRAYRRSCAEQRRLVRLGDRQQEQLRRAGQELQEKNRLLEEQTGHLRALNDQLAREIETRTSLEAELRALATTDPLTGLFNRRRFLEQGAHECGRARRGGRGLAFLAMDLDHFKQVNDRFGHAAGDAVLQRFAQACRSCLRDTDAVGRTGGEEFAVLLPDTDREEACRVAERIRAEMATRPTPVGAEAIRVTVSIGVASYREEETFEQALARADRLLYAAKAQGRNRVESGGGEE